MNYILRGFTALLASLILLGPAHAQVAKVKGNFGVLLAKGKETFTHLNLGDAVPTGKLLIAMPRAEIVSGGVQATLLADVGKRGPLPILETAVIVNKADDVALDLSLERGLVVFTNLEKKGEAKVRVRVGGEKWTLTLHDPGTKVGLEIYGRIAPGIPPDTKDISPPMFEVIGLVLAGEAFLDVGPQGLGLRAPPGAAIVRWDSVTKRIGARRLEKLPDELIKPVSDREDKLFKELCEACRAHDKDQKAWLKHMIDAESSAERLAGVTLAGALDEVTLVREVLATSKRPEVREHAVLVLRHWLGREPGQVQRALDELTKNKGMSAVQARSMLQLLVGFDEDEKNRPEVYEMLIDYLEHSKQGVRELARWHLVRLAPAGRDIPFDAAAPEAERQKSVARWRQLIPNGQLPPAPKLEKKS